MDKMHFLSHELFLLLVAMILRYCAGSSCPTCSCVTDSLNLGASMEGYDPVLADPTRQPDPGFRGQIFEQWQKQVDESVTKNPFISKSSSNHYCELDFVSSLIRNFSDYHNSKIAGYTFKKEIHKGNTSEVEPFNSDKFARYGMLQSDELMSAQNFFLKRRGEIVSSTCDCITHTVEISSYVAPSLTQAFEEGLRTLHYAAQNPNSKESKYSYITFVNNFGTHYLTKVNMGAKLTFEKRFLTKSKTPDEEDQRKSCVRISAEASIGSGVMCSASARVAFSNALHCCSEISDDSGSGNRCSSGGASRGIQTEKVTSTGPWPTSGSEGWAQKTLMRSVPVSFELASISSLFDNVQLDVLVQNQQGGEREQFNGTAARTYFEKMTSNYCLLLLGEECIATGSGTEKYGGVIVAGGWDNSPMRVSSVEAIDTWAPPSLPMNVDSLTLTLVNNVLYQCGGYLNSHRNTDKCYKLDLSSSEPIWDHAFSVVPMHLHTAVAVGSQIWIVYDDIISAYDTATNSLLNYQAPFGVHRAHCAVSNGTHSVVIGVGYNRDEVWVNSVPSNPRSWHKVANLQVGRQYLGCLWFENDIFVTGGNVNENDINKASIIDTVTNSVFEIDNLVEKRRTHHMMVLEGKPAVLGGIINHVRVDSIETYDKVAKRWLTHSSKLNMPRSSFGLVQFIRE